MTYGFVLSEWHRNGRFGWERTRRTMVPAQSAVSVLRKRLRPWALEVVASEHFCDGEYSAYLVELAEGGEFDTYFALEIEEIMWFHDQEYVPAPQASTAR